MIILEKDIKKSKEKNMKQKMLIFALLMLVIGGLWGQGMEDFTNSTLTATYANGSFVGNNGITWTYVHSRNEGDYPIDGNGFMLRRSDEPSSLTATFSGGIGNFSVDTRKAFTGNTQRKLELVINGNVIEQYEPTFADGTDDTVVPFIKNNININGEITLILRMYGATGNQQITLDNITWTGFTGTGPSSPLITNVTQVTNPPAANESLTISATVTDADGDLQAVVLAYGINNSNPANAIQLPMTPGANNVFTATIPASAYNNGDRVYFSVVAQDVAQNISNSPIQKFFAGTSPVATVRVNDNDGKPLYEGYLCRVQGVALNSDGLISANTRNDFVLQDISAGINVFKNPATEVLATQNNIYSVIGTIGQFRGKTQISPTNIELIGPGTEPAPAINTFAFFNTFATAEQYESQLIGVQHVSRANIDNNEWPSATGNVTLTDGTNNFTLRVTEGTGLLGNEPTWPKDIKGILAQYSSGTTVYNDGYQIFLRSADDIVENGTLPVTLSSFTAAVIANQTVSISWSTESESNLRGYHLMRNELNSLESATRITPSLIAPHNTSISQNYDYTDSEVYAGNEYFYWLQILENDGTTEFYGPISVNITETEIVPNLPGQTMLASVYPNPLKVNSLANFEFSVKESETASLKIFNVKGQLVKEFDTVKSGNHNITWNGKDNQNRSCATGIYFYQLTSPSFHSVQKMLIVK